MVEVREVDAARSVVGRHGIPEIDGPLERPQGLREGARPRMPRGPRGSTPAGRERARAPQTRDGRLPPADWPPRHRLGPAAHPTPRRRPRGDGGAPRAAGRRRPPRRGAHGGSGSARRRWDRSPGAVRRAPRVGGPRAPPPAARRPPRAGPARPTGRPSTRCRAPAARPPTARRPGTAALPATSPARRRRLRRLAPPAAPRRRMDCPPREPRSPRRDPARERRRGWPPSARRARCARTGTGRSVERAAGDPSRRARGEADGGDGARRFGRCPRRRGVRPGRCAPGMPRGPASSRPPNGGPRGSGPRSPVRRARGGGRAGPRRSWPGSTPAARSPRCRRHPGSRTRASDDRARRSPGCAGCRGRLPKRPPARAVGRRRKASTNGANGRPPPSPRLMHPPWRTRAPSASRPGSRSRRRAGSCRCRPRHRPGRRPPRPVGARDGVLQGLPVRRRAR